MFYTITKKSLIILILIIIGLSTPIAVGFSVAYATPVNKITILIDPGHGGIAFPGSVPKAPDGTQLVQYREAVLNMQIAQKVRAKLQALGMTVIMTREGDTPVSLDDRANLANSINADIFLSIHHDSATATSTGTTAFYSDYKPGVDTQDVYVRAEVAGEVLNTYRVKIGQLVVGSEYQYIKEENGDIYIMYNGVPAIVSLSHVIVYDRTPSIASQKSKVLAQAMNHGIASLGLRERGVKDQNLAVTRLTNGVSVLVEVGFLSNYNEFLMISQDAFQEKVAAQIVQAIVNFYNN
jgi:N-acetylmuramoyl-L-alanine amidase